MPVLVKEKAATERSALAILALREHSCFELKQKLLRKGFGWEVVDRVVQHLVDLDLVSDRRFTESFVRSRINKGQGPVRIQGQLRERRVAEDLIDSHTTFDSEYWLTCAARAYRKRFGSHSDEPQATSSSERWNRQARFLAQRGFPASVIYRLLDQLPGGETESDT